MSTSSFKLQKYVQTKTMHSMEDAGECRFSKVLISPAKTHCFQEIKFKTPVKYLDYTEEVCCITLFVELHYFKYSKPDEQYFKECSRAVDREIVSGFLNRNASFPFQFFC